MLCYNLLYMNYKTLSSILGVAVFALLWMVLFDSRIPFQGQNPSPVSTPEVKELGQQMPTGFPAEFSPSQRVIDLKYYTSKFEGSSELSQVFITVQDANSLTSYYQKVFRDNGWQIQGINNESNNRFIAATKGDVNAMFSAYAISGSDGSILTQVRLSLSFSETKR